MSSISDLTKIVSKLALHSLIFLRFYLFTCREDGRGEKEREKTINVKEIHLSVASHKPQLGTWPATQGSALTGNRTGDLLVHRVALSPLSHTIRDAFTFKAVED